MNEETLFDLILKTPESERAALLDRACEGKPELRQRVEALLMADKAPAQLLAPPTAMDASTGFQVTANYSATETPGTIIAGKYKLLQQIGEGGMGSVWMADQTEPVKRRVAVKLIRTERGSSKTILARFEAERQAIALMDHPNIAKLLDAGETPPTHVGGSAQPYFVMELVKGVPLTEFCDQHKLSIPDRLSLFMQICSAVQHAHQKGIIHRDLKPSNILVELHDDKPVPKVIDFGLAKATSGLQLTENTLFTGFGTVAGTPLYMAPEQANFNAVDIDTRADIYALGVILYELLTGTTPISRETIKKAALDEMMKLIREQDAPTPSSRLSSSEMKPAVAANRHTEPLKLGRYIKGELDWIVMKALSKERDRRYETANGFARDVERFLNHEAVLAGPVSAGYRLKKFVTRNKGKVIAAGLVAVALLLGIMGTTLGLFEAKRQEQLASDRAEGERLAKLDSDAKRQEAERNLTFAKKGNDILGSVFTGLDPKANYATVAELRNALKDNLAKAVKELDGSSIGDPLEVAAMQNTLGLSLLGLGEASLAIDVFGKSLATRKERLGAKHHQTLESMVNLAQCYLAAGMLDKALPLMEESHKLCTANLGTDHPTTLISMNDLAIGYAHAGKIDKAIPLFETVLKLRTVTLGVDHPSTLSAMGNLASGYGDSGKWDKALPLFEETLKLRTTKLGADHLETLQAMGELAKGYKAIGKLDQALPLFEESLRLRTVKLGADHPNTLVAMNDLAAGYQVAGKLDQALPLYEATLKMRTAKLGADHPSTLQSMNNLATSYHNAGKMDQALPLYEATLKLITAKLGADHPQTLQSMSNLASCYSQLKLPSKSIAMFEEALKGLEARLSRQHPTTLWTVANLGVNYNEAGRQKEAIQLLEESYRASKKYPKLRFVTDHLRDAYATAGETAKYVKLVQEQLADARQSLPKDSPQLASELALISLSLLRHKMWTEAEPLLRECLAIREKAQPNVWSTYNIQSMLGESLMGQKKYTEAEPLLHKGYEGMKQREKTIPANGLDNMPRAHDRLIQLYTETNKPAEVKQWQAEKAKISKTPEKK